MDKREQNIPTAWNEYLDSIAWWRLRKDAIKRDGSCTVCDETKLLEVHHRRSPPPPIELTDNLSNVTVLCRRCHHYYHHHIQDMPDDRPGMQPQPQPQPIGE